MQSHLHRADQSREFLTNERCHILEMLNNHDSDEPFSIARARVEPGVTTTWHRLSGTVEHYYIVSGSGSMEIEEEDAFTVKENDIVEIPADAAQRITNIGVEDLVILCICSPPFTDANYEELE